MTTDRSSKDELVCLFDIIDMHELKIRSDIVIKYVPAIKKPIPVGLPCMHLLILQRGEREIFRMSVQEIVNSALFYYVPEFSTSPFLWQSPIP